MQSEVGTTWRLRFLQQLPSAVLATGALHVDCSVITDDQQVEKVGYSRDWCIHIGSDVAQRFLFWKGFLNLSRR